MSVCGVSFYVVPCVCFTVGNAYSLSIVWPWRLPPLPNQLPCCNERKGVFIYKPIVFLMRGLEDLYGKGIVYINMYIYIYIIQSIQSCVLKNRCHFPGQPCLPPWHQVVGLRASRAARSAAAALWRWSDFDETAGGTQSAKAPQGMWNRFVPDLMLVLADTFWDLNLFPKHVLWWCSARKLFRFGVGFIFNLRVRRWRIRFNSSRSVQQMWLRLNTVIANNGGASCPQLIAEEKSPRCEMPMLLSSQISGCTSEPPSTFQAASRGSVGADWGVIACYCKWSSQQFRNAVHWTSKSSKVFNCWHLARADGSCRNAGGLGLVATLSWDKR